LRYIAKSTGYSIFCFRFPVFALFILPSFITSYRGRIKMPKSPPEEFEIHVDSSCVSDSTDLKKPSKRHDSEETTIDYEVHDAHSDQEGSQLSSQVSRDEHAEALIHATARAVVASLEQDNCGQEDSVLSARTDESYEGGNELTYEEDTYGDESEQNYESDVDHAAQDHYDGSASSHHEDDVFSPDNGRSNRSSLNSITDEEIQVKPEMQEEDQNREQGLNEDLRSPQSHISRASSNAFSVMPEPLNMASSPTPYTPSKVNPRPPFRTPSSIRAMQMSSPTPSVFGGSPRSSKRPTVSRVGTPQSQIQPPSKNKTPTRFKAKKESPLVLLHVTVLPLHWPYSAAIDAMAGDGLTRELHNVRESWRLLQEKLRDTVLERGILLPHPQDSYEMLEERLLEALELPVRPRARILSCGHYIGPDDFSSEEDSENEDGEVRLSTKEKWCDICGREVKYEEFGVGAKKKRFRLKVYASNGLMTAGSWAAAWREMERVDVEMVPSVPSHLVQLMDCLTASPLRLQAVDRPIHPVEHAHESCPKEQQDPREEDDALQRRKMEEERLREVYGDEVPEPPQRPKEDRRPRRARAARQQQYGDSLPELILAALKVAMRDKKNVLIVMLSVLVLGLAIRGRPAPEILFHKESILPAVERDTNLVQDTPNSAKEVPSIGWQTVRTGSDPGSRISHEVVKPEVVKPVVIEPKAVEPEVVQPMVELEVVEPVVVELEVVEPVVVEPEVKPAVVEPEVVKPAVVEPEVVMPAVVEPEVVKPVVVVPVESVPDEAPARIREPEVKEQSPSSAPKEVVTTPNDPCQECKRQLASQVTSI
jgi:hypothetical protein